MGIKDVVPTHVIISKDTKILEGKVISLDSFGRGVIELLDGVRVDVIIGSNFVGDLEGMLNANVKLYGSFSQFSKERKVFVYDEVEVYIED